MAPNSKKHYRLHPSFKLNGFSYTVKGLRGKAQEMCKTGEPYEEAVALFILEWLDTRKYVSASTSGSTGTPKLLKIRKSHMQQSALATGKHFKIQENTKALLCLPAQYIAGKMMLVRSFILGWHLDLIQPKSNPLDSVLKKYNFCAMTPFQLDNSLSRLHLLDKLIVGGGFIPYNLLLKLQQIPTKVYETYGMTETVSHIAARRVNSNKRVIGSTPFKALKNVTIGIDDRGCLVIKAPKVSSDPIVTNDLVTVLTYKKFLWLGRIDNVVNSGGIKLHPEQIERKLDTKLNIPFFVAGLPDSRLGERLVLFIEDNQPHSLSEKDYVDQHFDPYEFPRAVITIDRFDRTPNGKIKRGATVQNYLDTAT